MELLILLIIILALSFYIWVNWYKEGYEQDDSNDDFNDILTTDNVTPGITMIDRYKDPMCKQNEYIYCVDGQIECNDILGGTIDTLGSIGKYISGNKTTGDTLTGCSSFINKINLSDYQNKNTGVSNTRGVYFDLSFCSSDNPWRMGGWTPTKIDDKWTNIPNVDIPVATCYDTELNAANAWDNITKGTNIIFKKGDNVFISEINSTLSDTVKKVLDIDNTSYKIINNAKYYKAVVTDATSGNYTISIGPPGHLTNVTVIGNLLIKDSLFNIYANDYYSDLTSGSHTRPICKKGVFTSCLASPPFTIENGVYVPTSNSLDISYGQNKIINKEKINGTDMFNQTNPSGIIDKSNILEYNYYDTTQLESNPFIKCVADNGTQLGQSLCCGQNDTLKNTNYICPEEVPTCKGYSKDENIYGICT